MVWLDLSAAFTMVDCKTLLVGWQRGGGTFWLYCLIYLNCISQKGLLSNTNLSKHVCSASRVNSGTSSIQHPHAPPCFANGPRGTAWPKLLFSSQRKENENHFESFTLKSTNEAKILVKLRAYISINKANLPLPSVQWHELKDFCDFCVFMYLFSVVWTTGVFRAAAHTERRAHHLSLNHWLPVEPDRLLNPVASL